MKSSTRQARSGASIISAPRGDGKGGRLLSPGCCGKGRNDWLPRQRKLVSRDGSQFKHTKLIIPHFVALIGEFFVWEGRLGVGFGAMARPQGPGPGARDCGWSQGLGSGSVARGQGLGPGLVTVAWGQGPGARAGARGQ